MIPQEHLSHLSGFSTSGPAGKAFDGAYGLHPVSPPPPPVPPLHPRKFARCVDAVGTELVALQGASIHTLALATTLVTITNGRTPGRARHNVRSLLVAPPLVFSVAPSTRTAFTRAVMRGLRHGGCLRVPHQRDPHREARREARKIASALASIPVRRQPKYSGDSYGFKLDWGGEDVFTVDTAGGGTGASSSPTGASSPPTGASSPPKFDANDFAAVMGALLAGTGALFTGIGSIASAVNNSGGDFDALTAATKTELAASANELLNAKNDLTNAILANDALAERMAQDRIDAAIANSAAAVEGEQSGLGTAYWVGIGLGGVALVGLIGFLAMRGRAPAAAPALAAGGASNFYSY